MDFFLAQSPQFETRTTTHHTSFATLVPNSNNAFQQASETPRKLTQHLVRLFQVGRQCVEHSKQGKYFTRPYYLTLELYVLPKMTCSVRILTTHTLDSSPSILLVSPDGSKTVVNCGEGCQRSFLEYSQKMTTVNRVCLTHLSHDSIGGLPGMILTSSDVTQSAIDNAKAALEAKLNSSNNSNPPNRKTNEKCQEEPKNECGAGLDVIGPHGTQKFIHSLRHFMKREKFELRVQEGEYSSNSDPLELQQVKHKKQKRKGKAGNEDETFRVRSLAFQKQSITHSKGCALETVTNAKKRPRVEPTSSSECLSFIFTSPPILGKFLAGKATALGIPKGPLYGQLKSGKSVVFHDKSTGEEKRVESSEVVESGHPGVIVAVLYYPTHEVLRQLIDCPAINELRQPGTSCSNNNNNNNNNNNHDGKQMQQQSRLEVVVHMTPRKIFMSESCIEWMQGFWSDVEHIFLETSVSLERYHEDYCDGGTPFVSAASGALARSLLSSTIYQAPKAAPSNSENEGLLIAKHATTGRSVSITKARLLLEYILIPRSKKGFRDSNTQPVPWEIVTGEAEALVQSSGSTTLAQQILLDTPISSSNNNGGEILFTGTGSAIPCKHRNVSGIYVRMDNGNALLLDVGEGTTGQLLRVKQGENYEEILQGIKAVWISHPHADHHLGILRLLTERQNIPNSDPLVLIAPPNLQRFLEEYAGVDPTIDGSYHFLNCYNVKSSVSQDSWSEDHVRHHGSMMARLERDLGITSCTAVPVAHCAHAFAVVFRGTSFGCLAYSGDCRPSMAFAKEALNADVLIHEATFEDGMESEATVKKHCTVGEALDVASHMQAKAVILTHFSQRYPRIPPLSTNSSNTESSKPVLFAFDFASFTLDNLVAASKLTPALRLLYPDEDSNGDEPEQSTAQLALEIPGFFAQKEIL
jgi:ribonuclease Z